MALVSGNHSESYSARARGYNRNSLNLGYIEPTKLLETSLSFKNLPQVERTSCKESRANVSPDTNKLSKAVSVPENFVFFSPLPVEELDAAAVKVQKVYKSYRTRRHLADCAVVIEELWWKALDFAALKRSSVSFFGAEKPETAASKWSRARTRAAKVGKGLSKDEKAQKLALRHWLEAIDPRHRYGHNLHLYYDIWSESASVQPFFYWLDIGDGKEVNLEECPRAKLQRQCIEYLGPNERESFEVVIENGKLVYKQSGAFVHSVEGTKWIFVLSTTRNLYVGQKQKGHFQHSSFLAGGAITAAGRLMVNDGVLKAIWPYSGHYLPTEENFNEFLVFLKEQSVDLATVKRYGAQEEPLISDAEFRSDKESVTPEILGNVEKTPASELEIKSENLAENSIFGLTRRISRKWSTGVGPRIGCVREYPTELQIRALEQVHYSPRVSHGHISNYGPIPSPRPSPKHRLSPRVSGMGLPSPRTPIST